MRSALALARRGVGETWPNPSVGCVLVKDGHVIGRGRTARGGRPHAETQALLMAGPAAFGATAYVTLEPCSHHGQTPPCADAMIKAGVRRAVVAMVDPDPRVSGRGLDILRAAGIEVVLGTLSDLAEELNAGYLRRVINGRPLITVKLATSLDGRIATHSGESKWISGPDSRAMAHRLRADSDAVMIGSGTALVDNPDLTCRLPGLEDRSPIRIIIDGRLRLPLTAKVVVSAAKTPTWIISRNDNPPERIAAFLGCGVEVIEVAVAADGKICLAGALRELGRRGLTRVLVEGGSFMTAALLRAKLVDRLAWFHAPILMGGDGIPASSSFGVDRLTQAPRFRPLDVEVMGSDVFSYLALDTL
jgi:diaminohydroxyphosphoribosylaminopyrimidine deaminase/5-amino-6-(5-phosphoribosylamino)uracil reductase